MPDSTPTLLFTGPSKSAYTIALAHGAGAPMDSPFMEFFAVELGRRGIRVARFEFPYMAKRRDDGKKRGPDRAPVLRETWLNVAAEFDASQLVIGGKSMGGRIASLVADEAGVAGLVCLGYPFHPPGKLDKPRTEHLHDLKTRTLILQGERDSFGKPEEVAGYELSPAIEVHWLPDGDHSFKPRKSSGRTEQDNWNEAVEQIATFVSRLK